MGVVQVVGGPGCVACHTTLVRDGADWRCPQCGGVVTVALPTFVIRPFAVAPLEPVPKIDPVPSWVRKGRR